MNRSHESAFHVEIGFQRLFCALLACKKDVDGGAKAIEWHRHSIAIARSFDTFYPQKA